MHWTTSWWCCSRTGPWTTCSGTCTAPEDGKTFEGVIGKDLSNPIPEWAEHGADRKVVPYTVATDMDSPNPDSGEEYYHTNTQLFNTIDEHNRFKIGEGVTAPWNAPPAGATPTMDGFVTDYISTFTGEIGPPADLRRVRPHHDRVHPGAGAGAQRHRPRVRGVRPLVLRGAVADLHEPLVLDRGDLLRPGREQPGDGSGSPKNDAETIFERLEAHGKTWKVYVMEPMPLSFTGIIHYSRLKDRLATHFVPFAEFEKDAAAGYPAGLLAHRAEHDLRPRRLPPRDRSGDRSRQSTSASTRRPRSWPARPSWSGCSTPTGPPPRRPAPNVWNTALLIGWDEPGGTYDHVPPGPVPPPDPAAPAGEFGFTFDRSGYRVPAIIVSPWVEPGSVYNEEYRHTSLIATLRKTWDLGEAFTRRDAAARTFEHVFTLDRPRDPDDLGDLRSPAGARMDDGPRGRGQSPQRPRQRPHPRPHRACEGNGCAAPTRGG